MSIKLKDSILGNIHGNANTATTLQTARTINGTAFNGSKNITTSNWGTARTLTVGNSGKTVDGSENVSWSLSEIGAAPVSHSHNYAATSHNHGLLHDNFTASLANTNTDNGWSMINSSYNGFILKSIRAQESAPSWILGDYSAGVAFGGADTKGVLSVAYHGPIVRFAGGNGTKPVWNFSLTGTSGKTYNMDSFANSSHTHNYLPLSGGVLTGNLTISGNNKTTVIGTGGSDIYLHNSKSGKYLQLKDDGTLSYSDNIIYHSGRKPTASDIGATTGVVANAVVQRDVNSDISVRLVKATYMDQNTVTGALAFRVNNNSDNYVRFCSNPTAISNWLGLGSVTTHAPLITNLNSQLQSGWYSINPNTSGRPSGVDWGVVLQIRWYNGADFYQILVSSNNARLYTRGYINGGYTNWNEK